MRGGIGLAGTGHVGRKLALMMFVGALSLHTLMLVPLYHHLRADFIAALQHDTTKLFGAAVDPRQFPGLATLTDIGGHLVRTTQISGGVYVTGIGEAKAEFGEAPVLTWKDARLKGASWRLNEDHSRFEIFLGPEITGTPYGVVLGVDAAERWQGLVARMTGIALLGPLIAAVLAFAALMMVRHQIVRPLRAVADAVDFALDDPAIAQTRLSDVRRRDEIGRLSRAIDQLLFFTSTTLVDDLAASLAVTEKNPHGILTFSSEGHLLTANAAALGMFGARDIDSLLLRQGNTLFRFRGEATTAMEMLANGKAFGPGEIVLAGGGTPCMVGGDVVRRSDGSPLRLFLIFVDVSEMVEDMRDVARQRQEAEKQQAAMETQLADMRSQFEACLVLLELDRDDAKRANSVTVSPGHFVDAWQKKAIERGALSEDGVACSYLSPLIGDTDEIRRLFNTAFEVICQRSAQTRVPVEMVGRLGEDGMVTITVWANPPKNSEHRFGKISAAVDVSLMLAAIGVLARRQGGSLAASVLNEDGNALAFTLPADLKTIALDEANGDQVAAA